MSWNGDNLVADAHGDDENDDGDRHCLSYYKFRMMKSAFVRWYPITELKNKQAQQQQTIITTNS